jgi:hypothetical protein
MNERPDTVSRNIKRTCTWAALASVFAVLPVTLATAATPRQAAATQAPAAAGTGSGQAASGQAGSGQAGSLPMPVDEIIRRFAQHESDFKVARENYTYSQEVLIQEPDQDGGEYRLESEIVFTPQGKRYENVT